MSSLEWLRLFLPFIAVRDLYVSEQLMPFAPTARKELTGERSMEVLPALNRLFLEGFQPSGNVQEVIEPFVSSRRLSGHPVFEQPPLEPTDHRSYSQISGIDKCSYQCFTVSSLYDILDSVTHDMMLSRETTSETCHFSR